MNLTHCSLCSRALLPTATTCACGASIDWLARAPATLREKLRRGIVASIGAATVSTMVGCSVSACAADVGGDSGCASRDSAARDEGLASPDTGEAP